MKKKVLSLITILLFICLSFSLFSCKKDEIKIPYKFDSTYHYISNINYEDYLIDNDFKEEYEKVKISSLNLENKNAKEVANIINKFIDSKDGLILIIDKNIKTLPIKLKSNTYLKIEKDCSIEGITYQESKDLNVSFSSSSSALINAVYAENIKIYGPGSLVCHGTTYTNTPKDESPFFPLKEFNVKTRVLEARKRLREAKTENRPNSIYINNSYDIEINAIRIYEAANWTIKIEDSEDINLNNIVIDNNVHVANTDGIDLVGSINAKIKHCFIATGDDAVCIKTYTKRACENVEIDDCIIISMANGFKIGTETVGDVSNIICKNCKIYMPQVSGGYSGIAIESADGANVSDIIVDNIKMIGESSPLLIWLGNRFSNGSDKTPGSMKNITIRNIDAKNVEMASAITGYSGHNIENVILENFNVSYRDGSENLNIGPENYENGMDGYPEITRVLHKYILSHESSVYYDMPVYGIFVRNVENLTKKNINITPRKGTQLPMTNK